MSPDSCFSGDDPVTIEVVPPSTTWPLRREVLRPGRSLSDVVYAGEDDVYAAHLAAVERRSGTVVSVGSVLLEAPEWWTQGWRVRGMATAASWRGRGLGSRVLASLLGHVGNHGGGLVWCNARTGALHLYERAGFVPRGEVFEIPDIGAHLVMWRTVPPGGDVASPGGPGPP